MQRVTDLIQRRDSPAQLCVYARGEMVIDLAVGCEPESLFGLLSASKPRQLASRETFGHNGSCVCLGWADPQRQAAMASVTGRLVSRSAGARHMSEISDAVLAVVGS